MVTDLAFGQVKWSVNDFTFSGPSMITCIDCGASDPAHSLIKLELAEHFAHPSGYPGGLGPSWYNLIVISIVTAANDGFDVIQDVTICGIRHAVQSTRFFKIWGLTPCVWQTKDC